MHFTVGENSIHLSLIKPFNQKLNLKVNKH